MKIFRLLPILFLFPLLGFQTDEVEKDATVKWSADRPLTWKDFTGEIDTKKEYDAWTYAGINYVFSWEEEGEEIKLDLNAWAYFDPAQSWVKKARLSDGQGKQSAELLAHEQIHFDIAQLHCLYFIEAANKMQYSANIEKELQNIFTIYYTDLLAMQIQYDDETDHFKNKVAQKEWAENIKKEIESY